MNDVDKYLAGVKPSQREELQRIRDIVKNAVPDAEEGISYQMPGFKYKKKYLLGYAAFKDHMSLFPTADPMLEEDKKAISKYRTSKGTLQFTEDNPIPEDLLKRIVEIRVASIG